MTDIRLEDDNRKFRACPHCTIQIPADEVKCPHCGLIVPPLEEKVREESVHDPLEIIRMKRNDGRRRRRKLWVVSLSFLLFVVLGTFLVKKFTGINVEVVPVEGLEIKDVRVERVDGRRMVSATLVNNRRDVPVLSLRAIGVSYVVETKERVFTETVYPVGPLGEPGALHLGEEGVFSVPLPNDRVLRLVLKPRLIDLGSRKKFYSPRRRPRR